MCFFVLSLLFGFSLPPRALSLCDSTIRLPLFSFHEGMSKSCQRQYTYIDDAICSLHSHLISYMTQRRHLAEMLVLIIYYPDVLAQHMCNEIIGSAVIHDAIHRSHSHQVALRMGSGTQ